MTTFHTVQLKKQTFEMIPIAKDEFQEHHREFDRYMLSNNKIIYEALRYYIGTGKFKSKLENMDGEK